MTVPFAIERAVRSVHQIELSSKCSLRCSYCPSPDIVKGKYPDRRALHMERAAYLRSLEWVRYFVAAGSQDAQLNLAGIGESTLHPDLVEFLGLARGALGEGREIAFATNGSHFTEEHARALAAVRPAGVWVSMHRPEIAEPAVDIAKRFHVFLGATMDPVLNPNAWGGQVKWRAAAYTLQCSWLAEGRVMVMADGRVTACCLDASGAGVVGHVDDDPAAARTRSYRLCSSGCHHVLSQAALDRIASSGGSVVALSVPRAAP